MEPILFLFPKPVGNTHEELARPEWQESTGVRRPESLRSPGKLKTLTREPEVCQNQWSRRGPQFDNSSLPDINCVSYLVWRTSIHYIRRKSLQGTLDLQRTEIKIAVFKKLRFGVIRLLCQLIKLNRLKVWARAKSLNADWAASGVILFQIIWN